MRAIRRPRLATLVMVGVVSLTTSGHSQSSPSDAGGRIVIEATVVDRDGAPILGLSARDLAVSIDGVERPVVAVTPRNFGRRAVDDASAARVPDRTFLIVLDRTRIDREQWQRAAKAVRQFVDGLLPGERVEFAVVPARQPSVLRFDDDRERVKQRIEQSASSGGDAGRPGADALGEVVDLVRWLGAEEGPKHAVIVSGPERRRAARAPVPDMPAATQENGRDSSRPQVTRPRDDESMPVGDARVDALSARALGTGTVVDVLQLGGPGGGGAELGALPGPDAGGDAVSSGLVGVATRTGGFAATNLEPGAYFKRLARELSATYAFTVGTWPGDHDGKAHRVRVRVNGPRGVIVRVRERVAIAVPPAPSDLETSMAPPARAGVSSASVLDTALLDRATTYVQRFEREFSHVVAEERYVQVSSEWTGTRPLPARDPRLRWVSSGQLGDRDYRRQLLSDFLLVQSGSAIWHAYRDVAEVDLRKVRDRADRVSRLFIEATPDSRTQLDAIAAESARLNIGFRRTINTPTFALQFLMPRLRARFSFEAGPPDPIDTDCCAVVRFREASRPTMVRSLEGGDVPLSGAFWIEPSTGVVRRTVLETRPAGTVPESTIDVSYRSIDKVSVRVPVLMYEYYRAPQSSTLDYVEGLATYSNFRVFSVTTSETLQ